MTKDIVSSQAPVTLLGGAPEGLAHLERVRARAPRLVAADSGAEHALAAGLMPDRVIGDMDSIGPDARRKVGPDRLVPVAEQESTDFEKCLTRISAPLIIGLGFLGRRVDHQLAAFTTLARHPDRACLLLGDHDAVALVPPSLALPLSPGERVSLYPLGVVSGQSTGLAWPIDGLMLSPIGRVGTSNRATGPVRLEVGAPTLLVILPAERWELLADALHAAPRWHARDTGS